MKSIFTMPKYKWFFSTMNMIEALLIFSFGLSILSNPTSLTGSSLDSACLSDQVSELCRLKSQLFMHIGQDPHPMMEEWHLLDCNHCSHYTSEIGKYTWPGSSQGDPVGNQTPRDSGNHPGPSWHWVPKWWWL